MYILNALIAWCINCKNMLGPQNSTSDIALIFISVFNQLDAQHLCFAISLFHASTCFEHMCSSSGGQNCITQPLVSSHLWVWWCAQHLCFAISLFHASTCFEHMCSSSGGQNCITQPLVRCDDTRGCVMQFWPPDDEHNSARNM